MSDFRYQKDAENIVTVTLECSGVNLLSAALDRSLKELVGRLEKDEISGVILALGGGSEVNSKAPAGAQETFNLLSSIKGSLRRLEMLGKPVVATLSGKAVGTVYEISLAAHRRIALNSGEVEIGLPEVKSGVIPGGGGTVRLARLIGLEKSLPLVMGGTTLAADKAQAAGLVDEIADSADDLVAKAKAWIKANPTAQQPWDAKGYKIPGGAPGSPSVSGMIFVAPALLRKQGKGRQPAVEAALATSVESAQVDVDSALRIESRYLISLLSAA